MRFAKECKDCEQKKRNERKNADRPRAIIVGRATIAARKAGESLAFFMQQLEWQGLIPRLRTELDAPCLSCGHPPLNERDVQIDHIEPIRSARDWARQHARNLRFMCGSCNRTKAHLPFAVWLDAMEGARLSNLVESPRPIVPLAQLRLFSDA